MQRVGVAAAILGAGFLASKVLGLVRSAVLAAAFGTGPELDAYFAAFRIPDLIFQLTAAAAMGSAFVPAFSGYLARGEQNDAWTLASSMLGLVFAVTTGCAAIGYVLAPVLVPLLAPGFPPATAELAVGLTRLMLLSTVFFSISGIVTGILNSRHHFLLPAVAPLAYNGAIIGGAWWLAAPLGIYGPAVGVVAGAALHLIIQAAGLPLKRMSGVLRPSLQHAGVRDVLRLTGPRILGLAAMHANFIVITVLASTLPAGSLTALTYGWAVMMVPMGIFGMAFATAVFPSLAALAATDREDDLRNALSGGVRYLLYVTIPAGVGMVVLAEPLVRVLFQRGQFAEDAVAATATTVAVYGTGLFAFAALEVITRGFYARHDTVTPLVFGVLTLALNVIIGVGLIGPLGIVGLATGHAVSTVIEFILMYEVLRRKTGGLHTDAVAASVGKTALAAGVMAAVLITGQAVTGNSNALPAAIVAGGAVTGALTFFAIGFVVGSEEARGLMAQTAKQTRALLRTASRRTVG